MQPGAPALNEKAVGCSRWPHGTPWFPGHPILSSRPSYASPFVSPASLSSPDTLPPRPPGQRLGGPPRPRNPQHLTHHPQWTQAPSPGRWPQQQLSRGAGTPASLAAARDDGHAYPLDAPGPSSVFCPLSLNTSPEPHVFRHVPPPSPDHNLRETPSLLGESCAPLPPRSCAAKDLSLVDDRQCVRHGPTRL